MAEENPSPKPAPKDTGILLDDLLSGKLAREKVERVNAESKPTIPPTETGKPTEPPAPAEKPAEKPASLESFQEENKRMLTTEVGEMIDELKEAIKSTPPQPVPSKPTPTPEPEKAKAKGASASQEIEDEEEPVVERPPRRGDNRRRERNEEDEPRGRRGGGSWKKSVPIVALVVSLFGILAVVLFALALYAFRDQNIAAVKSSKADNFMVKAAALNQENTDLKLKTAELEWRQRSAPNEPHRAQSSQVNVIVNVPAATIVTNITINASAVPKAQGAPQAQATPQQEFVPQAQQVLPQQAPQAVIVQPQMNYAPWAGQGRTEVIVQYRSSPSVNEVLGIGNRYGYDSW